MLTDGLGSCPIDAFGQKQSMSLDYQISEERRHLFRMVRTTTLCTRAHICTAVLFNTSANSLSEIFS